MRAPVTIALVALLAISAAPRDPAATPAAPAMTARILITKSHEDIGRWVLNAEGKRTEVVPNIRVVTRGVKIFIPMIATFSSPQAGSIDLRGVIQIISPSGSTLTAIRSVATQVHPQAPRNIVLNPVGNVTFDASDDNGEYKLRATIRRGTESFVAKETFRLE